MMLFLELGLRELQCSERILRILLVSES